MGCTSSAFAVDEYTLGHDEASMDFYKSLYLSTDDLTYLHRAFSHIDIDMKSNIRIDECMVYFDINDTKFNRAVFGIVSKKENDNITFLEFVAVMWNFLTVPVEFISTFVFDIISKGSTTLTPSQILSLFEMVHTKELLRSVNMKKVVDDLKDLGVNCEKCYTVAQFDEYMRTCSFMLAPVINMQVLLRSLLIGTSFWSRLEAKRNAKDEFKDSQKLTKLKNQVALLQQSQMNRISSRVTIERAAVERKRSGEEKAREATVSRGRTAITSGAKRVRSSFVQMVHRKKKGGSDDEFLDIDDTTAPSQSDYTLPSVSRKRTPSMLVKNANLVRQEKRSKKSQKEARAREEAEAMASGKPMPKKSGPGRFTIALMKKKAQSKVGPE